LNYFLLSICQAHRKKTTHWHSQRIRPTLCNRNAQGRHFGHGRESKRHKTQWAYYGRLRKALSRKQNRNIAGRPARIPWQSSFSGRSFGPL
jgi:hypothetical protein